MFFDMNACKLHSTAEIKQNVLLLISDDAKTTHVTVQVAVSILNLDP
jgi:hypothetical protein